MKKGNLIKTLTLIFLILCTVAIVVVCAVFVNNENNKNHGDSNNSGNSPSSYSFSYGNTLTVYLYETISFAPTNALQLLIYSSSDSEVFSISQNGNATANKCGNVTVTVREGDKAIKTVSVTIVANYTFKSQNCAYANNTITMSSSFATVEFCMLDRNSNEIDCASTYTLTSTGVRAYQNFGLLTIEAEENGSFTLTFDDINLVVTINVVVN